MADRALTHHVNVRNPRTKKVETFEPGADLPTWAQEQLEGHAAYVEDSRPARALVASWQAQKAQAEALSTARGESS